MVCEHKIMTKNVCFTVNWLKKDNFGLEPAYRCFNDFALHT